MSTALRSAFFVRFLVGVICFLSLTARTVDAQVRKKTSFGAAIDAGSAFVKYREACISFRVRFIAGDFFNKVSRHKTAGGLEFRGKKKTIYTNFPDQLVVDLDALVGKCLGKPAEVLLPNWTEYATSAPAYAFALMEKPSIALAWKRGNATRPVALGAKSESHDPLRLRWFYVYSVNSAAVPLTDSMEIDVSLQNGVCRIHMTANLDPSVSKMVRGSCDS